MKIGVSSATIVSNTLPVSLYRSIRYGFIVEPQSGSLAPACYQIGRSTEST